jgi:predicted dehydrogenase
MNPLNRRTFLATSALAAAWTTLPRALAQNTPSNRIRIGVVGVRSRGNELMNDVAKLPGVEITAICDVDSQVLAQRLKSRPNAKGYTDARKMLEDKNVDAVIVATPNHTHSLLGIWALEAGKHLFVEKPLSHNIWEGRQLVGAAAKFSKLVAQAGTQSRSGPGIEAALRYVREGNLGKILVARGICYKARQTIGKAGKTVHPEFIDNNLWHGPAEIQESVRTGKFGPVHYDWHWFWNYGGGDILNQGVHEVDVARWFLGEDNLAPAVATVGARLGMDDAGETPNTLVTVHSYAKAPLVMEVRGLPKSSKETQPGPDGKISWSMDSHRGVGIGIAIECEGGVVRVPDYVSATVVDKDGKVTKRFGRAGGDANNLAGGGGNEGHLTNWLECIRAGKPGELRAPIRDCHLSTSLVHASNVALRTGLTLPQGEIKERIKANSHLAEAFGRAAEHLAKNGFADAKLQVGALTLDPSTEKFTGEGAEKANADLIAKREGRGEFKIPTYLA